MANDPAFLFYPGDYLRDTQCLSESVQVAYDRIMCEHMRNICISQQRLNFFTKRLSEDEVDELKHVLTEVEGGFQITWVAESISKRKSYSEGRRKNRLGRGDNHMNNICATYDEHMENENEIENVIIDDKKGVVGENKLPQPYEIPKAKASKIFIPPLIEDVISYFFEIESSADVANHFFDYYAARGWKLKTGKMSDWKATARTWIRNETKYGKPTSKNSDNSDRIGRVSKKDLTDFVNQRSSPGSV